MVNLFEGTSADDVWNQAKEKLCDKSAVLHHAGRGGLTFEILHAIFSISDPKQRWIVSRNPAINPAFAIAEVVWILNGRNDSTLVNYWNSQLSKYTGETENYHGAYGFRLRQHFEMDQVERAYKALCASPGSRQIALQIWDPRVDLPDIFGDPTNQDIPCNMSSLLKIREGKLDWTQIVRSNDLFRGVPYNFVQFSTLQEIFAGWLGVEVGSFTQLSDSLHLYQRDYAATQNSTPIVVLSNSDSLALPWGESWVMWQTMLRTMEEMMNESINEQKMFDLVMNADLKIAFKNLLYVVAAEAARRRKWFEIVSTFSDYCVNPVLVQAWNQWWVRMQKRHNDPLRTAS